MMLYIHIPFCQSKCLYCDFVSFPQRERDICAYVDALGAEMALRPCDVPLRSVFLGGGTPSLLPKEALARLFGHIRQNYEIAAGAEISVEVNPGTAHKDWLAAARRLGVSRLSIGVQAMQDPLLRRIGRIHSAEQALLCIAWAKEAGFQNLSADLMFGLPGQTMDDLLQSLRLLLAEGIGHVSCYNLIVEEGTPIFAMLQKGELCLPDEDAQMDMWEAAQRLLAQHGLLQYEVSNYAKPGLESRHNMGYWQRQPYIGLGCAAHSFVGNTRFANPDCLDGYLACISKGASPAAPIEILSAEDACFEELMLGLRMTKGIQLSPQAQQLFAQPLAQLKQEGLLEQEDGYTRLSKAGFPLMNSILARFL